MTANTVEPVPKSLRDRCRCIRFPRDLHLEYAPLREPFVIPEADVCVVAGDLCHVPANGVRWRAEHIAPSMPCVYVAGNRT
jgi:hypothetical protein